MKILHITPSYLPAYRYGGPIVSIHELNKQLVQREIDVTVYTTNIDGNCVLDVPLGQEVLIDGVKVFYFPITFRPWKYSFNLHKAIAQNLKNFDIVHITSAFLSASTLGAYYSKKFNKPYVISPRGSLMIEPLLKKKSLLKKIYISLIEKSNLFSASAVHFTSSVEKEEYLYACLPFKKAVIMPNCLDILEFQNQVIKNDFRQRFGIDKNKKIVLCLGRISWKKGFDTLIPAFDLVLKQESNAVLVIAGPDDENYRKEIKSLFSYSRELENKIIFTGMLLGQEKVAVLRESNVFVLPSYSENFGQSVVEAMASGLPVVITREVAIAKEVLEYKAGIVVQKDTKEVSEAILEILHNNELAKTMVENGKKLVTNEFSCDRVVDKYIEAYESLTLRHNIDTQ